MPILKADIPAPLLPQEKIAAVPELGGDVIVRPLMLSDRLALAQEFRANGRPKDFAHIASLLAYSIVDANHEQLFTADQWEAWGSVHTTAALELWDVAWGLSGLATDAAEKNSEAQNSSSQ